MAHMMTRMTHKTRWLAGSQFVKTPSLRPIFNVILILREVFAYYCHLHGPSLPQQINCDKYCSLILGDDTSFFFLSLIILVFMLCYFYSFCYYKFLQN